MNLCDVGELLDREGMAAEHKMFAVAVYEGDVVAMAVLSDMLRDKGFDEAADAMARTADDELWVADWLKDMEDPVNLELSADPGDPGDWCFEKYPWTEYRGYSRSDYDQCDEDGHWFLVPDYSGGPRGDYYRDAWDY